MRKEGIDMVAVKKLDELVSKSDRKAFNALFDMLWDPMYSYAASIIMDSAVAKDLVQDVWMDYWQRRAHMEVHNVKSYLYKAIRYSCYNSLRNSKFNKIQIEAANSISISSEVELEENVIALTNRIDIVMLSLPERCQEVFKLSRVNNVTNKEIAEKLNISQRSVENQLSLALRKLRKDLSTIKIFFF